MKHLILIILSSVLLAGCAGGGRVQYHGVAPKTWKQLTPEQRTLIIDSGLRDAMNPRLGVNNSREVS